MAPTASEAIGRCLRAREQRTSRISWGLAMSHKRIRRAITFSGAALVATLVLGGAGRASAITNPTTRELTFEQRVKAQEAIERVYYSHQLAATDSFEKAVPRSLFEAKVTRYLKESAALQQVW